MLAPTTSRQPASTRSDHPEKPRRPPTLGTPGSRSALIVGGRTAGLSAALGLGEAGYAVTVYEAESVSGGRLAARELDPLYRTSS